MAELVHASPLEALASGSKAIRRAGLCITEAPLRAQVVVAGHGVGESFRAALGGVLGTSLRDTPNVVSGDEPCVLWLDPLRWLVLSRERDGGKLTGALRAALGDEVAGVHDVSDGQAVLDVIGERASELLAAGCALDLHPSVFAAPRCARTLLAGLPVLLYPHGEGYRVHAEAPLLGYLWQWLTETAEALAPPSAPDSSPPSEQA